MSNKNKIIQSIICLIIIIGSVVVWASGNTFDRANLATSIFGGAIFAISTLSVFLGTVRSKKVLFKVAMGVVLSFWSLLNAMQFVGGGFIALFNVVNMPRFISFIATLIALISLFMIGNLFAHTEK